MTVNALIIKLNSLFTALDDIYYLNEGGCCHAAYLVAKELEKRNLNNFILRVYNDYVLDEELCFINIENNYDAFPIHSDTAIHYVLVYNNIEINPINILEDMKCINLHGVDSCFISKICKKGDWNCMFDTNNLIFIRRFIKIIFDQYDKENKKH